LKRKKSNPPDFRIAGKKKPERVFGARNKKIHCGKRDNGEMRKREGIPNV
jgi:hypothetical protein